MRTLEPAVARTFGWALCAFGLSVTPSGAQSSQTACEKLVLLYVELAEQSGQVVTVEEARAEVMSENPTDEDCGAMLALFPGQE